MSNYKHFGVMLDMSRNGVTKVSEVKRLIRYLEKMGYNMIELYTEDTFKIESEPMFGYLRGGYTKEEIKELDAYAREHGIELIPCIQTLAHLFTLKRVPQYRNLFDTKDILLAGDEKVYALIDKIFATMAECYSSRHINIGMDEAHMLGLGTYLDKHGYHGRYEIISAHLTRVVEIARKYGFTCHMWSDMFFRIANGGVYYPRDEKDIEIPKEVKRQVPEDIGLTFWTYYQKDKSIYDRMFRSHKDFDREVWFAGGAWCWSGFSPVNYFSLATMLPAMRSVRDNGIEHVFITMWGDDGSECSFFSTLPVLYAIKQYADGIEDEAVIKAGFKDMFGFDYDDFMYLDAPTKVYTDGKARDTQSTLVPTLFYNDPFLGQYDVALTKIDHVDFAGYRDKFAKIKSQMGELSYLFDHSEKLCDFLDVKAYLGIETRAAYKSGDKKALADLIPVYDDALAKLDVFYKSYYDRWMRENKPQGWEVQDIRLGGLTRRLETCRARLADYLAGKIDKIDELEETLYSYGGQDGFYLHRYVDIVTTNIFSHNIFD